ncbi:MAG: cytochrome c biogenesis heme-transporting ATPase CcmA [Gammaproteobacteria bacterium]|nr:cytochrome c biogenesis heme-transporting ATPase CcmA [Gammaproteobacteria bacterium]
MTQPTQAPEPADEPFLAASDLACFRGDRLLFRGLDFAVRSGQALQVRGPNGCGKTTLLRMLCGLTRPESGVIRWRGRALAARDPEFLRELRYVGHSDGVKLALTPRENLRALMALGGFADASAPHASHEAALETALARLALAEFIDVPCRTLSAGQRRRVALARLALGDSRLWLLDEPFTALDATGSEAVHALVDAHLQRGGCAVLTSHQSIRLDAARCTSVELGR